MGFACFDAAAPGNEVLPDALRCFGFAADPLNGLRGNRFAEVAWSEQFRKSDPIQHLRAQAVGDGEADIGTISGRIDMHAERASSEGSSDDTDDSLCDQCSVRILRNDLCKRLLHLCAETRVRTCFVFRGA